MTRCCCLGIGFSPTDVWAGTLEGGLYHYDGSAWSAVTWPGTGCASDAGIRGLWGADGVLFIYGPTALARWDGKQMQTLAQWSCDPSQGSVLISSLWGNSPTEVFSGITDQRQSVQPLWLRVPTRFRRPAAPPHVGWMSRACA
jgi:hypothetical protein